MRSGKLLFSTILLFVSCVDNYDIPKVSSNGGYLVVEGFINSNGPTTITLSHSVPLNSKIGTAPAELHAEVNVESEDNIVYPLAEQGKGVYRADDLSIDSKKRYRIYIKTAGNQEYVSEYAEVKHTPPIGDINFEAQYEKGGVQIYVSTSDPDNAARYYNWTYVETWQYRSYFQTSWEYIDGQAVYNPNRENILDCWLTGALKNIIITSTAHLSKDVVQNFPLAFVPSSSSKFKVGYRISVIQSALTKEAYQYLAELKRNAEQQGSLFDPLPSDLLGNLRCLTNPEEPALGYVSAHNTEEKSIFIYGYEAPPYIGTTLEGVCPGPKDLTDGERAQLIESGEYLPANDPDVPQYPNAVPPRVFVTFQPRVCVDCRERGGTNVKPADWPFINPPIRCCPPE
jgi:hypothetical protein